MPAPRKYPAELRARAVRLVFDVREEADSKRGAVARVADRRDVAAAFGVNELVRRTSRMWSRMLPYTRALHLVVEAVGHQIGTLDDAITGARQHGTILYFGIQDDACYPVRFGPLMGKNLVMRFGRIPRPERREALRRAVEYVARHPDLPAAYVTHLLPFSEAQKAYEMASGPAPGQLKIVLGAAS